MLLGIQLANIWKTGWVFAVHNELKDSNFSELLLWFLRRRQKLMAERAEALAMEKAEGRGRSGAVDAAVDPGGEG